MVLTTGSKMNQLTIHCVSRLMFSSFVASGATYRFRVVATVANGNSQQSPSSEKVYMTNVSERQTGVLLPAPVIVEARALSSSEIFIGWQVGAL